MVFGPSGHDHGPQKPLFLILGPPNNFKSQRNNPDLFLKIVIFWKSQTVQLSRRRPQGTAQVGWVGTTANSSGYIGPAIQATGPPMRMQGWESV